MTRTQAQELLSDFAGEMEIDADGMIVFTESECPIEIKGEELEHLELKAEQLGCQVAARPFSWEDRAWVAFRLEETT